MLIDTHCHLNFKAFEGGVPKIIARACTNGVKQIIIPGTDIQTSEKAISLSQENLNVYALVGIHPHHAFQYMGESMHSMDEDIMKIEQWLAQEKVVGIGEVGLDRHAYSQSRYGPMIEIDKSIFAIQIQLFVRQVRLATHNQKSLCIHNREAETDLIHLLSTELKTEIKSLAKHSVFHCCEANDSILSFAIANDMFIGVDGDVTFNKSKQEFIKQVPLNMIVLETDSPYILPEPLRSQRKYPNEPCHIPLIAETVALIKNTTVSHVAEVTTLNAQTLYNLPK